MAEKLALLDTAKKALADQFEALAADILERKTKSFSEGSETELGRLLTPLKDQIKEFREKVEQAQTDSKTGVTRLETLIGTLGGLNQKLSEEAHNLTTALRGSSKDQGDWGEDVARDLLELGGSTRACNIVHSKRSRLRPTTTQVRSEICGRILLSICQAGAVSSLIPKSRSRRTPIS